MKRSILFIVAIVLSLSCSSAFADRVGERTAPDGRPSMITNSSMDKVASRTWHWADNQWPTRLVYPGETRACPRTFSIIFKPTIIDENGYHDAGYTDTANCTITLARDIRGIMACVTVVHEAGHVSGLEHQPSGVMQAGAGGDDYPPCWNWFDYTPANAPTREMSALLTLGWGSGKCTLRNNIATCKSKRHHTTKLKYQNGEWK